MSCQRRRFLTYSGSKTPFSTIDVSNIYDVVYSVSLVLIEIVRKHGLRFSFFPIKVGGNPLIEERYAALEISTLTVDHCHVGIHCI